MSDQRDIAVDLGVAPEPLPAMVSARELIRDPRPAPPQIVRGVRGAGALAAPRASEL